MSDNTWRILKELRRTFKNNPRNQETVDAMLGLGGIVPVLGEAVSTQQTVDALRGGRYGEAAVNSLGMLPMVPALGGVMKGAKQMPAHIAPQVEALRLAQQRAALPVEQHGLGLRPDNTPEERAEAMDFINDRYHGSVYDIKRPSMSKASTESHAGQGFYSTDSPEDASMNYATIYGPDVKQKVEMGLESMDKGRPYAASRLYKQELTPRQQEVLLGSTMNANNAGVVYPLKVRADKPVHLDRENPYNSYIGPFEQYDEATDTFTELDGAEQLQAAVRELEDMGGDATRVYETVSDYGGDAIPPDALYDAVKRGNDALYNDYGDIVSSGVAAANFLRNFGVDEITHTPKFNNPQLNLGDTHTISFNPDNIRSRFAAFDPWRRNTALATALGLAAPDLLAEEQPRR